MHKYIHCKHVSNIYTPLSFILLLYTQKEKNNNVRWEIRIFLKLLNILLSLMLSKQISITEDAWLLKRKKKDICSNVFNIWKCYIFHDIIYIYMLKVFFLQCIQLLYLSYYILKCIIHFTKSPSIIKNISQKIKYILLIFWHLCFFYQTRSTLSGITSTLKRRNYFSL